MPSSRLKVLLLFALGFFCLAWVYAAVLFDSSRALLYRDLLVGKIPQLYFIVHTWLHERTLPIWNSFQFAGAPFFADPKSAVLHPLNSILPLFPIKKFNLALSWYLYLHHVLMFTGAFLFAHKVWQHLPSTFIFAFIYSASGIAMSANNLSSLFNFLWLLPFFCYFLYSHIQNSKRSASGPITIEIVGLAVCLVLAVFCGAADFGLFLAFLLVCSQFYWPSKKNAISVFIVGLLAVLLSAWQLFPSIDLYFDRPMTGMGQTPSDTITARLHPLRMLEFFLSFPFGSLWQETYFGWKLTNTMNASPLVMSYYMGACSLVGLLAAVFVAFVKKKRFLLVLLGFAFLLSIVSLADKFYFNVYSFLYSNVPFFSIFRYPEKFYVIACLILLFLGVYGLKNIFLFQGLRDNKATFVSLIAAIAFSLLAFLHRYVYFFSDYLHFPSLFRFFIVLAGCFFILAGCRFFLVWRARWILLSILVGIDILLNARALLWGYSMKYLNQANVGFVRESLEMREQEVKMGQAFRLLSIDYTNASHFSAQDIPRELSPIQTAMYLQASRVAPATGVFYKIKQLNGIGAFANEQRSFVFAAVLSQGLQRYANFTSSYYVVQRPVPQLPRYHIQMNPTAAPYVFFPERLYFRVLKNELIKFLRKPDFLFNKDAVIEQIRDLDGYQQDNVPVFVSHPKNGHIRVEVPKAEISEANQQLRFLMINESYDKHWHASVRPGDNDLAQDPVEVPVRTANGWAIAIELDSTCRSGCTVDLQYKNRLITVGFWTSFLTLVLLVGYLLWYRRRSFPSSPI